MYSKINQSPKHSLTPLAARAESSDTSYMNFDFQLPKPPFVSIPRSRQSHREILRRLSRFSFPTYESLRTDKFSLFPRFPGNTDAEIARILKNPRALKQFSKTKGVEIQSSLEIPPAPRPKMNITGFLSVGDGVLRQENNELVRDEYPSRMTCRDVNLAWGGFQIEKPRDSFVSVAVEFSRAGNYVYQQRLNTQLDVLKISRFVVQKLIGIISEEEMKGLLDLVVVALTGLQMAN